MNEVIYQGAIYITKSLIGSFIMAYVIHPVYQTFSKKISYALEPVKHFDEENPNNMIV